MKDIAQLLPYKTRLYEAVRQFAADHKKVLCSIGAVLLAALLLTVGELAVSYSHYAGIVDARLADRSLMHPAGIYAAPGRVSIGQHLTQDGLIERLLRVGYREGEGGSEFSAGSFSVHPGLVELRSNEPSSSTSRPSFVRIRFNRDRVNAIEEGETNTPLRELQLPAELLTPDINTKKQTRRAISFADLPPVLISALIAIEDRRFFEHPGVDLRGMVRALYTNVVHGRIRQGGSTLTQQLIKDQFLTKDRTYSRKLAEIMMSIAIERKLTKEQILTLYCDRVYLGQSGSISIYGFKQAASILFGKELKDISLSEAACLAGLAQAPNRYSVHSRLDDAIARRNVVLQAMVETDKIIPAEADAARREELAMLPPQRLDDTAAPHFVDYVRRELASHQFEADESPHLRIETTIDLDLQEAANHAVARHLDRLKKIFDKRESGVQPEVSLIALDPRSGEILAMVGGRDYTTSQLNRTSDAMRQPGSVFKPIVYAAALSRGLSPAMTFMNSPREIKYGYKAVYRPENFRDSYSYREVTLREAMVRSLNVVTVDAAMRTGLGNVAEMAARVGLPRPETYPSMALGAFEATPLEVASAYTTFVNGGIRVDPLAVRTITSNGEIVVNGTASKAGVLSAPIAYLVTDALAEVVNRGTAASIRGLGYRGPAAGKTGTSRDAWFVGYTPKLLVVVWVGYDDNRDLRLTGGEAAVPIWVDFVKQALELRPDLRAEHFEKPAGLETVEMCPETGTLANEFCPQRTKVLIAGSTRPGNCFVHHEQLMMESDYQVLEADLPLPVSDESALVSPPQGEKSTESSRLIIRPRFH